MTAPALALLAVVVAPAPTEVGVRDRLGAAVPRDVVLVDHDGRARPLGELLDGRRPLVLVPAYYRCPMLCGLVIGSTAEALARIDEVPGRDFEIATVSFDPRDGPADAERARARALDLYGDELDAAAWPFLTGPPAEVGRLLDAIGFDFAYDEATDQYAHGAAIFVVGPQGELARVLPGPQVAALDLRLALVEAGRGEVGTFAEQAILTCYRYDPVTRRYGFWVLGFLRIAGAVLLVAFGIGWIALLRRDRRRMRGDAGDPEVRR